MSHFNGIGVSEVSLFHGKSLFWFSFWGFGIEEFHCIQRCPHFKGVGIEGFHCIQRCPHVRGLEHRIKISI